MGCGAMVTDDYKHGTTECPNKETFNKNRNVREYCGTGFCPVGHDYSLKSML